MPRATRYFFGLRSRLGSTYSIRGIVPSYIWHIVTLTHPWASRHKNFHVQNSLTP